jgi:hypothetical protein
MTNPFRTTPSKLALTAFVTVLAVIVSGDIPAQAALLGHPLQTDQVRAGPDQPVVVQARAMA